MSDNNKLPEQAKPQEFELVELLFREYISSHIARPDIEYSFQARFQSLINQIPSYLHSVSKMIRRMYLLFTENNKHKKQTKNQDIGFTKDEWKTITGREYTDDDDKKLEISVIHINKSTGSINVAVEKQDIQDAVDSIKPYHEMIKQFVDAHGQYIALEDEILKLANSAPLEVRNALKLILEYTKKIHDHYQST